MAAVCRRDFDPDIVAERQPNMDLSALDAALRRLAEIDPVKARLVELRFFAGMKGDRAAAVLEMSTSSAARAWVYARAWLRRELGFGVEP
jgi:hypothetical protein